MHNIIDQSNTPANFFKPLDTMSEELLQTVPKKVFKWLESMGVDISKPGQYGQLRWNMVDHDGTIIFGNLDEDEDTYVQIWWKGEPSNPSNLVASDIRFEFIGENLDFFASFEENVYAELENLSEERDK